jgi:uncharacterized protein involved in type VI secretion and phage assembly
MTHKTPTIHRADDNAAGVAEFLRELSTERFDSAAVAAADEQAWRQATRAVELCRRAAELAARRSSRRVMTPGVFRTGLGNSDKHR